MHTHTPLDNDQKACPHPYIYSYIHAQMQTYIHSCIQPYIPKHKSIQHTSCLHAPHLTTVGRAALMQTQKQTDLHTKIHAHVFTNIPVHTHKCKHAPHLTTIGRAALMHQLPEVAVDETAQLPLHYDVKSDLTFFFCCVDIIT